MCFDVGGVIFPSPPFTFIHELKQKKSIYIFIAWTLLYS